MFAQVARVFNLSLITSENALFFFDSMIAASIERTMTIADVQLNGLVALLVASKMYGTCPQFKVVSGLIPLPSLVFCSTSIKVLSKSLFSFLPLWTCLLSLV
jgi:hypothetical protein